MGDDLLKALYEEELRKRTQARSRRSVAREATDKQITEALQGTLRQMPGFRYRPGNNSLTHAIVKGAVESLDPSRTLCVLCGEVTTTAPTYKGNHPRCKKCRNK